MRYARYFKLKIYFLRKWPVTLASLQHISHEEGITACEEFSQLTRNTGTSYSRPLSSYLVNFGLKCFYFQRLHYLQVHGTAMGTCMAPSYTNLFTGKLEWEFLRTKEKMSRVWWRYIDDIFAIWTHGELSLQAFIESLNCHHPTIKFTATWSGEQLTFLDTRVYLKNGWIKTDIHVKRTDRHRYLWMDMLPC